MVALVALALAAPRHPELPSLLAHAATRPPMTASMWRAMALAGHPEAARVPLEALDDATWRDAAADVLALVCDATIASNLGAALNKDPTPRLVRANGWVGAPETVPLLIELLGADDDELINEAAYALDRITGAQLYEEAQIDPDKIMVDDAPVPTIPELEPPAPLAKQVSDPRDLPSDGSPDTLVRPATSAARWTSWWQSNKRRFSDGARYRRGHGFTPRVALWELDGWVLTAPDRRHLQDELVVRTGRWVRFDPSDFVSAQLEALAKWRTVVEGQASSPGSWARPSRRA
jgi:hypothetical protein